MKLHPSQLSVKAVFFLQVHFVLRDLIRQSINETVELKRFPTLQAEIAAAATRALEAFRDDSKKLATRLVDMEVRLRVLLMLGSE